MASPHIAMFQKDLSQLSYHFLLHNPVTWNWTEVRAHSIIFLLSLFYRANELDLCQPPSLIKHINIYVLGLADGSFLGPHVRRTVSHGVAHQPRFQPL